MKLQRVSRTTARHALRYGAAAAVVVAALITTLYPTQLAATPFAPFFIVIGVAGVVGGLGPGLLATALTLLVFITRPPANVFVDAPGSRVVALLIAFVVVLFSWKVRQAYQKAKRSIDQAMSAQRRFAFLAQAGEVLAASLDFETTLSQVAHLAVPALADLCIVDLLEADGTVSRLAVAHADPAKEEIAHTLRNYPPSPNESHPVLDALRTGKAVILQHTDASLIGGVEQDHEHRALLRRLGFHSAAVVPLVAHERILGALSFVYTTVNTTAGRHYGAQDLALAEDLAQRCALAVDNARMYRAAQLELAERKRAEDALTETAQRLNSLLDISTSLTSVLDASTILDRFVRRLVELIPAADLGAIHTYEPLLGLLVPRACAGPDVEALRQVTLQPSAPFIGTVFSTGTAALLRNREACAALRDAFPAETVRLLSVARGGRESQSYVCAPLRMQDGQIMGTVTLGSTGACFTEADLALLEGVTAHAAVALENAELYARVQRDAKRLEAAVTELKATQQQVIQQERLRALGQMASGIAHDFNNALASILGFSELLLVRPEDLRDETKALSYIKLIHTAARDAAQVAGRLREFYRAREGSELFLSTDLGGVVRQAISLAQPKWKDQAQANGIGIDVEVDTESALHVFGSEGDLREALMNLIFNAVDALPNGGTIRLRAYAEGHQAILEVSDTGVGMTEAVRRQCLEPFFTTKGEGGTGMGLAMVYGIVRRHEGTIDVHSAPGDGTTFRLSLPLQLTAAAAPDALAPHTPPHPLHILVVDDEPMVRQIVTAYLETDGHSVETASTGREGIQKFGMDRFDLVVTDRAMPGMNGDQVAATIKQVAPATPIILLTGFGELMHAAGEVPTGVDAVVSKPATLAALRDAITSVREGAKPVAV